MKFNMRGDANHVGPVMLSDVYTSAVGSAKDGVAASQRALYDAYNSLNSRITPTLFKTENISFDAYTIGAGAQLILTKAVTYYKGFTPIYAWTGDNAPNSTCKPIIFAFSFSNATSTNPSVRICLKNCYSASTSAGAFSLTIIYLRSSL